MAKSAMWLAMLQPSPKSLLKSSLVQDFQVALEENGDGEPASILLDGMTVGEGERESDGGWTMSVMIPGTPQLYPYGPNLDDTWDYLIRKLENSLLSYRQRLSHIEALRARIIQQTGEWMDIHVDRRVRPDGVLRVPKAPFQRWALTGSARHLWPVWTNVCSGNMRILNDDPNHSDWLVGAGLDPAVFGTLQATELNWLLSSAVYDIVQAIQAEFLGFRCAVLAGTGSFEGQAWHALEHAGEELPLLAVPILPDLSVRWLDVVMASARVGSAVIVEQGGAVAHLVTVAREHGVRIVRVKDARRLYPDRWTRLLVDCDKGRVDIVTHS